MGEAKRRRMIREVSDRIAREWSDKGLLIEGGWRAALEIMQWGERPEYEQHDLRLAFFAGAQHLFGAIMQIMDDDREPTEDDLRRMNAIAVEVNAFAREMMALLEQPEGRA